MPVILGIDPGSNTTGFGVISVSRNSYSYITSGNIHVAKKDLGKRLRDIFDNIFSLVKLHQPQEVAIEQVFMHTNVNSALKLGQARGAAIVAVAEEHIKIAEYSARQVKQAVVGYGNAEKSQVQHMVQLLLKIKKKLHPDEADALAIAICHANFRSHIKL
jgi:crossover junction endodeoxyribonuclease RuvC